MARKVSNTYLPPSLLWTLQTGDGNQWQAEIEKFQFPPFPYTHTITKITCDRLRRDFLNFLGVGWIWGRILWSSFGTNIIYENWRGFVFGFGNCQGPPKGLPTGSLMILCIATYILHYATKTDIDLVISVISTCSTLKIVVVSSYEAEGNIYFNTSGLKLGRKR